MLYNRRMTATTVTNRSAHDACWRLRRQAIFRHMGELPIEVRGPDAEKMLNGVFTSDISKNRVGRGSYQFACYDDGGMIIDGIFVRLIGRSGIVPHSWSLDHAGPFAASVEDAALVTAAMADPDPDDPGSLNREADD
jgi:aminomethyltransferase